MAPTSSLSALVSERPAQLLATLALIAYSLLKRKLTPTGVLAATFTAVLHMLHPSPVFFTLLVTFFLLGTLATKVHHVRKAALTQSAAGGSGGEGVRNASQVFANSGIASLLIAWDLFARGSSSRTGTGSGALSVVVVVGVTAAYAAAAADTLSSELGILSPSAPFLITRPWQRVPRGTNGGVTVAGLLAGLLGSSIIAAVATLQLSFATSPVGFLKIAVAGSADTVAARPAPFAIGCAVLGLGGSVLDSVLGAVCQITVEDKASGRVIEGANGKRVAVLAGGSRVQKGSDILNNNGVNFAMTLGIAVVAMAVLPFLIT